MHYNMIEQLSKLDRTLKTYAPVAELVGSNKLLDKRPCEGAKVVSERISFDDATRIYFKALSADTFFDKDYREAAPQRTQTLLYYFPKVELRVVARVRLTHTDYAFSETVDYTTTNYYKEYDKNYEGHSGAVFTSPIIERSPVPDNVVTYQYSSRVDDRIFFHNVRKLKKEQECIEDAKNVSYNRASEVLQESANSKYMRPRGLRDIFKYSEAEARDYDIRLKSNNRRVQEQLAQSLNGLSPKEQVDYNYTYYPYYVLKTLNEKGATFTSLVNGVTGECLLNGYNALANNASKALNDDKNAQANIGSIYYFGKNTPKNLEAAAYWFTEAANNGHTVAQYNCGHMYSVGEGVPKDIPKAIAWLKKAYEGGYTDAMPLLHKLQQTAPNNLYASTSPQSNQSPSAPAQKPSPSVSTTITVLCGLCGKRIECSTAAKTVVCSSCGTTVVVDDADVGDFSDIFK